MHRAILHDPEAYPEPEVFNPNRFLRLNNAGELELDPTVQDPEVASFGFGRRVCPGRHLAYETLWLAIVSVLATFNISKAKDINGKEITPELENVYGFMMYVPNLDKGKRKTLTPLSLLLSFPKAFTCDISPRSAEHQATILATVEHDEL